jgi:ATP-dependent Clp protease protease subunit
MMLEIKLAKPKMENQEGMNHLWVRLFRNEKAESQESEIQIRLPKGIYRSRNLNGFVENEREHIVVGPLDRDVIIEIFTQDAIPCGEMTIVVSLLTAETTFSNEISIDVVEEDEMDMVEIDEQVVKRIKEISNAASRCDVETNIVSIQPRLLERRNNEFSYLEKKYRIDY